MSPTVMTHPTLAHPRRRLARRWLAGACALGASLAPLHLYAAECTTVAPAAAPGKGGKAAPQPSGPNTDNVSELTFVGLQKAQALMGEKKIDEAIEKLRSLTDRGGDYDHAIVYYNLGAVYAGKNDYPDAEQAFTQALSYKVLPQQQTEETQYMLGQLYIAGGQFDQGIEALQAYMQITCKPVTPEQRMFLASAMAERKRYPEALDQTNQALAQVKEPKESWVQFKLGVQYEMKDYAASADTLMELIALAPGKSEYWRQLSGVLLQANDEARATAVLALAERQGMLEKPEDIQNLYSTYMLLGEPLKAGQLIESSVAANKMPDNQASLEMVSNAWINARESEKAESTLKKLAGMSDKGEYYFQLGAMYGDQERWDDSKAMLAHALEKGGLKHEGQAYFRIAVADYRSNDIKGAMGMLQKAAGFDETRQQATEWMKVLVPQTATGAPVAQPAGNGKS